VSGPEKIRQQYRSLPDKIIKYISNVGQYQNASNQGIRQELQKIFNNLIKSGEFNILDNRINEMRTFLDQLSTFLFKRNIMINERRNVLSVELTKANKSALEELIEDYYKVDRISGFADFFFSHKPGSESSLSSGEHAMFMVFARLNELKNTDLKKSILMLIDEAELALHPQWQKEFIYHFTDFIHERFASMKVQVILTSHSPFILSDLPANCVVLLKKSNGKSVVVNSLANKNETFGANIHELFTDSFFLQDGLMGEFSRRKIEVLIKEINHEEEITIEKFNTTYRARVEMIGEHFLKAKILELLASKANFMTVDLIIEKRTNELDILNQIRKQKLNDQNRQSKS